MRLAVKWLAFPLALTLLALWLIAEGWLKPPAQRVDGEMPPGVADVKVRRTIREMGEAPEAVSTSIESFPPGLRIDLTLSEEQLAFFKPTDGWSNKRKDRQQDVIIGFDREPAREAIVKVHGESTLEVERKSYSVNLHKKWHASDIDLSEFYLISMEFDTGRFRMHFAYGLLRDLGLFDCFFEYTTLFVNERPQGLYLLVERPKDAIRRVHPEVVSIVRRSSRDKLRVKWKSSKAHPVDLLYQLKDAFDNLEGREQIDAYGRTINLDQYMLWLAFNSVVCNADFSDELFLYEMRDSDRSAGRFEVMAWDCDDLMGKAPSKHIDDPLLPWCEGKFDRVFQRDETLYSEYAAILQGLLTEQFTEERLKQALENVRATADAIDTGYPPDRQERDRQTRHEEMLDFEERLLARRAELLGLL